MDQAYFDQFQCTTSQRYQNELVALTTSLLKLLEGMHIAYYIDFASLLAVMRKVVASASPALRCVALHLSCIVSDTCRCGGCTDAGGVGPRPRRVDCVPRSVLYCSVFVSDSFVWPISLFRLISDRRFRWFVSCNANAGSCALRSVT